MKLKVLVFILLLFKVRIVEAESLILTYNQKVYTPGQEVVFKVATSAPQNSNACLQNLKIKPLSDIGKVEIYNALNNKWIAQNNSWEEQPLMGSDIKIRVSGVTDKKIKIYFEFQDTRVGKIYGGEPAYVWISDAYSKYIDRLNAGLLGNNDDKIPK